MSLSGLTQENPETWFLVDVYCSKQGFIVETGFLWVSPNYLKPLGFLGHAVQTARGTVNAVPPEEAN